MLLVGGFSTLSAYIVRGLQQMAHHFCMRLLARHVLGWLAVLDLGCDGVEEVYSFLDDIPGSFL